MEKCDRLQQFYEVEHPFQEGTGILRQWVQDIGLEEDFKWSLPTYTWNNKNIVSIGKFKKHYGLWFFQGGLLKDPLNVLKNAQEGKTKAMRHWKFTEAVPGPEDLIKAYIQEALENEKAGKRIPISKGYQKKVELPDMLKNKLAEDVQLLEAFNALTPGKQRDYAEHIATAKREETKQKRWLAIAPLIRAGKGLNDKYKK
jgi:uncharacterized protein YdeI (YjbR/CyaY-like superfamily)